MFFNCLVLIYCYMSQTVKLLFNILVIFQLAGALRNLTDISSTRSQFISHNVVDSLCKVMETYPTDSDLMLNVSRVFRCDL